MILMTKTPPGRSKSILCVTHKNRRDRIIQYLSRAKLQLLKAYASRNPQRINFAKARIVKYLYEISESKELGPTYKFKWGITLEMYFKQNLDPTISWHFLEYNELNWSTLAGHIERSIDYEFIKSG